ncbi:MAG: O-antigen ligase family protein [Planctomycetes bacterium]|nr:O-antigen ligase family protein [Planctomycetota bacterium]
MTGAPVDQPPAAHELVAEFTTRVSALPASDPRRIGLFLIQAGVLIALPSVCLGVFPANLGLGIALGGCLIARAPLMRLPGFKVALLLSAWVAVSCAVGVHAGTVPRPFHGLGLMYTWAITYPTMIAMSDRRIFAWGMGLLAGAVIAAGVVSIGQFVIGLGKQPPFRIDPDGPRHLMADGFFSIHLTHGFVMCMALLALQGARTRWPSRSLGWIGVAAAAIALVLSRARLAYVGIAVGAWAAIASRGPRHLLRAIAVAAAVALVLAGLMWRFEPERFAEMAKGENGRWAIWRASIAVAYESPVFGPGSPEGFKARYREIYASVVPEVPNEFPGGAPHAHNSLLSIASTYGVPGVIIYLALLGSMMRAAYRERQRCLACWSLVIAAVAASLSAGMFENLAGHSIPAYATFLVIGLAFAFAHHPERDPEPDPAPLRTPAQASA